MTRQSSARIAAVLALQRKRGMLKARTRKSKRGRRLLLFLGLFMLLLSSGGVGAVDYVAYSVESHIPSPRIFPADSFVYSRNGTLIAELHDPGTTRIPIPLSQVAPVLIQATLAVEDKNFWHEGTVDYQRVISAAYYDLRYGSTSQGASTIPMQLAKLLYLQDTKSLVYKTREVLYAEYLSAHESKQQILDDYLNDIFYGNTAQGIEAASREYFGIDASKLDLAQASMLAGLPNDPSVLDPLINPQAAKARQKVVLDAMRQLGDITSAQEEQALAEPLTYANGSMDNFNVAPFFVSQVANRVAAATNLNPYTSGLTIVSTLNEAMQQRAQADVNGTVAGLHSYNLTDAALVSVDPNTGDVLAYVGNAGNSVPGAAFDMASTPRQVGSTFKLFTYSTAIQDKVVSMVSPVLDGPISVPVGNGQYYQPVNYNFTWHGEVPLEVALGNSFNIPAVRVELLTGIARIIAQARKMGVTTLNAPLSSYGPSATLGSYPIPLWEMAQAASVIASGGTYHPAQFILSVTNANGVQLYHAPGATPDVLTPQTAYVMNTTLSNNQNRELEFGYSNLLEVPGHVVAAKTGTSDSFKDNWTIGWTPNLLTAVWAGNTNDSPMRGAIGITGAGPIWNLFMTQELKGKPDGWPASPPPGVQLVRSYWYGPSAYVIDGTSYHTNQQALLGGYTCSNFYKHTYCYSG